MTTKWYSAPAANSTAFACARAVEEITRLAKAASGDEACDQFAVGYGLAVIGDELREARRYVAEACAPWFDGSAFRSWTAAEEA